MGRGTDGSRGDSGQRGGRRRASRRRTSPTFIGELADYEQAGIRLECPSQPGCKLVTRTASGSALRRVSLVFGVGQVVFVSGGARIYAFGRARQMVGLIEMLGFQGLGGYRLALNARHDAAFSGPMFAPEVEIATFSRYPIS